MAKPTAGVVGAGVVGMATQKLCGPATVMYDTKPGHAMDKRAINACDVVFVCVPTPMKPGGMCDTSIVEEAVAWIENHRQFWNERLDDLERYLKENP